ncbi:bola-like protein [Piedraia hortae CBS 480.64]|uniref:Bola-like protein n=1 Tax=Piedraia hortae CBS 480.64 TaxID=1314780 RepID=A0A6A7C4B9_9PEZI|nr:bola-like protein [Piedraia hortae CBS 480.64]
MAITPDQLRSRIETELQPSHLEVVDLSGGCGQMYNVTIVSNAFEKKTALQRHRLVNSKLKDEIAAIHAWSTKCFTPEEWERKKTGDT